ncbi:hypothetical protein [Caballeronia cordobensis]|uniref:hypothetical protein n=1 Tax=Caballeronia cordobensis TaxID=1353886 RepID=UPI00045F0B4E|nr:putative membrane-localized protein [Burkholderia sp. RPE67]
MKKLFAIFALLLVGEAHAATTLPSSLINWVTPPSAPSQTAKYVFAAPNGSAGAPTFRQLVASDIPTLAPLSGNLSQFASTTSAQLAAVLSDETGTGANVFGTSPTITTPNIVGVTNASSAAAGSIGQYVSSDVPIGSAVSLTTSTAANITSVNLTAGDWLCSGTAGFLQTSTTTLTTISAGMNTVSATLPLTQQGGYTSLNLNFLSGNAYANVLTVGQWRYNVSTSTTVFLVAKALFTASTETAYGFLGCHRFH